MKVGRGVCTLLMAVAVAGMVSGCSTAPKMGRYNVTVMMDESMSDSTGVLPSVEVHLVGMDSVKGRMLQQISMSEYWNPNRKRDDHVKHVMYFGEGHPKSRTLYYNDPVWDRWQKIGAMHLFVMADMPGLYQDKDDVRDPRRLIIPLETKRWRHREIQIIMEQSNAYCLTPRNPKEIKKDKKGLFGR